MKKLKSIITTVVLFVLQITHSTIFAAIISLLFYGNFHLFNIDMKIDQEILITTFSSFLFMIFMIIFYRKTLKKDFNDFKENYKKHLKFGVKYWLLSVFIMIISNIAIQMIYPGVAENEQIVSAYTKTFPLCMLFCNVIYAPIVEELIYRKSIRDIFNNDFLYILFSGLIFGYIHTALSSNDMEILYVIPYGIVGCAFAYIHTKTNNIFTSICLHALHNGIVTLTYFLPMILK